MVPAAVHATLLWLSYQPEQRPGLGDEGMYLRAAEAVREHGASGLESFWPPAYAWFLAPLVAAADGSVWLVQLVQTCLLVLVAWLLGEFVEFALKDRWAADTAVVLTVAFPPLVAFSHYLWPEVLHLALMLGAVMLLIRCGPKPWAVVSGGALLALCLQTKVLLLPFLPMLAVGLWFVWPRPRRLVAIAVLTATVGLGVLPTVMAQQRDFGRPMLADSGWFNMWIGLNEVSRREFVDSVVVEEYSRYRQAAPSAAARSQIAREKIRDLVADRGWWGVVRRQMGRQYHRLFGRDSFLTHQLVGGAVWQRGDGYRAGDSVAGHAVRWLSYGLWGAVLAAAGWGIGVFPYRRKPLGAWVLGFLLVQCALFLVLHVKSRYRLQMLPGLFFFTVYAASWWRARGFEGLQSLRARVPMATATALAGALIWLAFSG